MVPIQLTFKNIQESLGATVVDLPSNTELHAYAHGHTIPRKSTLGHESHSKLQRLLDLERRSSLKGRPLHASPTARDSMFPGTTPEVGFIDGSLSSFQDPSFNSHSIEDGIMVNKLSDGQTLFDFESSSMLRVDSRDTYPIDAPDWEFEGRNLLYPGQSPGASGPDSAYASQASSNNSTPSTVLPALSQRDPKPRIPPTPPNCPSCLQITTLFTVHYKNRNGNAGRPYYKCLPCQKFCCFADARGLDPANPICHCGRPSRRGKTTMAKGGKTFYTCSQAKCDFYDEEIDEGSENVGLLGKWCDTEEGSENVPASEDLTMMMAGMEII